MDRQEPFLNFYKLLEILGRYKRHLSHLRSPFLPSNLNFHIRPWFTMGFFYIAHCDVLRESGGGAAGCYDTDFFSRFGEDFCALYGY